MALKITASHPSYWKINMLMNDLAVTKNPQCTFFAAKGSEWIRNIDPYMEIINREYQIEHTLVLLEKEFIDAIPSSFLEFFDDDDESD